MTFGARSDDKQKDRPVDVKRDLRLMNTIPANPISSIAHVDARGWLRGPYADVRSSGSAEGAHAGLELHRNITGRSFAGTPIAVQPAGTSLITNELAATIASSPIVTAPMMLA
jgi:hypothetical protein